MVFIPSQRMTFFQKVNVSPFSKKKFKYFTWKIVLSNKLPRNNHNLCNTGRADIVSMAN